MCIPSSLRTPPCKETKVILILQVTSVSFGMCYYSWPTSTIGNCLIEFSQFDHWFAAPPGVRHFMQSTKLLVNPPSGRSNLKTPTVTSHCDFYGVTNSFICCTLIIPAHDPKLHALKTTALMTLPPLPYVSFPQCP